MTTNYYYFRVSMVLVAVTAAAVVAVLVAYGNASAATSTGAIITVNTDQDEDPLSPNGKCSLREAITNANDNAQTSPDCPAGSPSDEDTINFNLGTSATITLDSTLSTLSITDANGLIIDGRKAAITISGNDTVQVFQESAGAKLTLKNLRVAHGKAETFGGGAYNNGGTLIVDHSTFSNNESGFDGGGIVSDNGGTLEVTNSTFSGNSAPQGGGVNSFGTLEVTNSTFSGNESTGNPSFGAGMLINFASMATVTKSTFSNNTNATADGRGAGIHNEGTLDVINSTLSGNNNDGDTSSYAGISNLGTLTVTSTTLSNNGIGNENAATLSNTILANVPSGDNCSLLSPLTDEGYNISDDGSCNFDESTSTSRNDTDPKLDPDGLKNNGGPTRTVALLKGSPALNAIPKGQNGCATATERIATDQRGVKRPQGMNCDIGAYEKKVKRH